MKRSPDSPVREAIFRRIEANVVRNIDDKAGQPLDWDDIGALCQGLAFAGRPLQQATRPLTARYSLGPRGVWMLNLISNGIVYPNELSDLFMIGRSLISAELARVTEAGLVESRPSEDDRRRTQLALTPEGEKVVAEVRAELEQRLKEALSGYEPEEVRLLARMLGTLRESVIREAE